MTNVLEYFCSARKKSKYEDLILHNYSYSVSLTTIYVEQNQCPSHQLILLTQGPIPEILAKKYWRWSLKNSVFFRPPLIIFFLLYPYLNPSQIYWVAWMGLNFYDYHDSLEKSEGGYRNMKHTVYMKEVFLFKLINSCIV